MALFGTESWSRRGDASGAYFALLSRLSVWGRDGHVVYLLGVRGMQTVGEGHGAGDSAHSSSSHP